MTAGQLPSGEQSQVLADLGVPEVFAVSELAVDGEIDGVVRLERWGYPDLGRMVVFIDGVRAAEGPLPMPEAGWPRSPDRTVDPTLLHHELSDEERSDLLGPPADRLPESGTEGVASLDADLVLRYHPETDVLVLERAGRLVSAQTLGVGPS
ncbi:MAG: hypothetical protein EA340_14650 [Nitriliruptor sp.]|nr:MAG: hypothetical protein EA340_14650 [Nitriliruptor sp.]